MPIISGGSSSSSSSGTPTTGWVDDSSETWTFGTFTAGPPAVGTFTVPTDLTAKYTLGTRIRLTQSSTVRYFVVSAAPSFGAGVTTVTITAGTDYTLANAAITANGHSYTANPQGYPGTFNFATTLTGWAATPTLSSAVFSVVGRLCFISARATGTSNATTASMLAPIACATIPNGDSPVIGASVASDNSTSLTTPARVLITSASTTITFGKDYAGNAWTASGTKTISFSGCYPI